MNSITNCKMDNFLAQNYKKLIFFLFLILPVNSFSQIPCHVGDSLVLVEFYWSANGPNWTNSDNWLTGTVSTWNGVVLAPDSVPAAPYRVQVLGLINNNLTGTISTMLCNLNKLSYLFLGYNNTTGSIPSCIGQLINLKTIILSNNHLTNPLPVLSNTCNYFMIDNNDFYGAVPDTLFKHLVLAELVIDHNRFTSLPLPDSINPGCVYHLSNNCFTFKDVISYLGVPFVSCTYAPQDSILETIDTTILVGANLNLDSWVDTCQNNEYHWMKNAVFLTPNLLPYSYYYKPNIQFADSGYYSCDVSNSHAPDLILHRRIIHVRVTDTTTSIPNPVKPKEIELAYNLSDALLTIKINQNLGEDMQCYLYDITGRQVLRLFQGKTIQQELHYYLRDSGIKRGPYFVKMEIGGRLLTKKIIIP